MIKKYNQFLIERIEKTNEGLKDWVSAFMMMVNVGIVPLSISSANAQTKKEFVENQPQDKVDAAKFVTFINKFDDTNDIKKVWDNFLSKNKDVKSNFAEVNKYITKDGKTYMFDKEYQKQDFSNIDINKFTPVNYLTDMGNFIDDSKEPSINNFIYDYGKLTSVEICIITVPNLGDDDEFNYTQSQFDRIKIGKNSSDNGILMVFSMEDRKWRIHTGYGMEGLLPDAICSQIGNNIIKPHFKEKDFYGGIMGALNEIKKNIDKNPEDIKRFKKLQEDKDDAEFKDTLSNVGYGALVLAIITSLIIIVYRKWKSAEEMKEEIASKLKAIDKMRNTSYGNVGVKEVDDLYEKFKLIVGGYVKDIDKLSNSGESGSLGFLKNQDKRVKSLELIYDDISKSYNIWGSKRNRLTVISSSVSEFNLSSIISSIDSGFKMWNELKNIYGVNVSYDSDRLKSKASELTDIVNKASELSKKSISDAEDMLSTYKSKLSTLSSSINSVQSMLSEYKTIDQRLSNWKSLIDSAVSDMNRYNKWSKSDENDQINTEISNYINKAKLGYDKKNMHSTSKELESILLTIVNMKSKWYGRKKAIEEEEERKQREIRRRNEEEEEERRRSSYSSSSSSSSSSFDGFGGGSSGGGGAGGSW